MSFRKVFFITAEEENERLEEISRLDFHPFLLPVGSKHGVPRCSIPAISLSTAGAALALVTEWLGGELVDTLGVGVHKDANMNIRNSLFGSRRSDPSLGRASAGGQRAIG